MKTLQSIGKIIAIIGVAVFSFSPSLAAEKLLDKQAEEYVDKGISEQKNGNFDSAITCYTKALLIDEKNPRALNNLGTAFAQKGLIIEAEKYYKQAIAIDPHYPVALMNLALLCAQRKDYDRFFEYWKRAKGLDFTSPFLIDDGQE